MFIVPTADAESGERVDMNYGDWLYITVMLLALVGLWTVVGWLRAGLKLALGKCKRKRTLDEPEPVLEPDQEEPQQLPLPPPEPFGFAVGFVGVTEVNTIPVRGGPRVMEKKMHKTNRCRLLDNSTVVRLKVIGKCQTCWRDD